MTTHNHGGGGMSPTTRAALEAIAKRHGMTLESIRQPGRSRGPYNARTECYRYLYDERKWSVTAIGQLFNRDHTTVVLALDNRGQRTARLARFRERHAALKADDVRRVG